MAVYCVIDDHLAALQQAAIFWPSVRLRAYAVLHAHPCHAAGLAGLHLFAPKLVCVAKFTADLSTFGCTDGCTLGCTVLICCLPAAAHREAGAG